MGILQIYKGNIATYWIQIGLKSRNYTFRREKKLYPAMQKYLGWGSNIKKVLQRSGQIKNKNFAVIINRKQRRVHQALSFQNRFVILYARGSVSSTWLKHWRYVGTRDHYSLPLWITNKKSWNTSPKFYEGLRINNSIWEFDLQPVSILTDFQLSSQCCK